MTTTKSIEESSLPAEVNPLCPVYEECGGCDFQHLSYPTELSVKGAFLRKAFKEQLDVNDEFISDVVASPKPYHYRNRLDLTMRRRKEVGPMVGFQTSGTKKMIAIEECAIADQAVSKFIPTLREEAKEKFTQKYRTANLVVKTGDDGRVRWGGIGRRSLQLPEDDYFWTEVNQKRIYYSLDTFFQANLSILPDLMKTIQDMVSLDRETTFLDLYAGVGLFGIYFSDIVKKVVMIEEVPASCQVMEYNIHYHGIQNTAHHKSRVEDVLHAVLAEESTGKKVAMIDPPRRGLSPEVLETLTKARSLDSLLYLSCHPESLTRDLKGFQSEGWQIKKIVPFDFFPKTRHLETLVMLVP